MMKRAALILLSVYMIFSFTGCWNNRDLNELAICTALGIDRAEDGKVVVSVQIVKASAAIESGKEGAGGGDKKGFVVVSNSADTVFGAIREMLSKVNNKVFYSSSQVIVFGEDAARDGIEDYMDFVLRDHETQFKALVAVAKGTTAREILDQDYQLSKVPGAYLRDTINNSDFRAFSKKIMLLEIARDLVTEGRELCTGAVEKEGSTTKTDGMAVFVKEKLVGWLDSFETRGYMFITGRVKSTVMEVEDPNKPGKQIAVEIQKASSEYALEWGSDGKPVFVVKIKLQGNIGEQYGAAKNETQVIKAVTESCRQKVKGEALMAIGKCQKEYKSDIFGFGQRVFDKNPGYWKTVKDKWNSEIFPEMEIRIEVDAKILRSGLMDKPIEVK